MSFCSSLSPSLIIRPFLSSRVSGSVRFGHQPSHFHRCCRLVLFYRIKYLCLSIFLTISFLSSSSLLRKGGHLTLKRRHLEWLNECKKGDLLQSIYEYILRLPHTYILVYTCVFYQVSTEAHAPFRCVTEQN